MIEIRPYTDGSIILIKLFNIFRNIYSLIENFKAIKINHLKFYLVIQLRKLNTRPLIWIERCYYSELSKIQAIHPLPKDCVITFLDIVGSMN